MESEEISISSSSYRHRAWEGASAGPNRRDRRRKLPESLLGSFNLVPIVIGPRLIPLQVRCDYFHSQPLCFALHLSAHLVYCAI